jgi:archaeal flagellar protein FlaI
MKPSRINFELTSHHAKISHVNPIETYTVNGCTVYITDDGQYLISEPALTRDAHAMYADIMNQLYYSLEPLDRSTNPVNYIEDHIWKEAEQRALTGILSGHFASIKYYLVRDVLGYGILDVLMQDENVEEITIERFDRRAGIIHRKYSEFNILDTNICFPTLESMNSFIQRTVQRTGHSVTTAVPIMNTMTGEGDRITVTYGSEISLPGPTVNIRKFTREPLTIVHLMRSGVLSVLMAAYFWMLMDAKSFGLLIGETGSGKTTVVNALMGLSNPRWKIVTIEETPELKIPHYRWIRLITRTSPLITQSNFDITIMDLIRASLRMRPDFEIVGEVRGDEAQYLFQSAATGHGGLTTFHASSAESAINRLASEPINIKSSQQMLLWYIAHITRLKDVNKKTFRKIISIKEIIPKYDTIALESIFSYNQKTGSYDTNSIEDLLQKSKKIHDAASMLNVDAAYDLRKRIDILDDCSGAAATTECVRSLVSKYYA